MAIYLEPVGLPYGPIEVFPTYCHAVWHQARRPSRANLLVAFSPLLAWAAISSGGWRASLPNSSVFAERCQSDERVENHKVLVTIHMRKFSLTSRVDEVPEGIRIRFF